jgi:hypothetical protein
VPRGNAVNGVGIVRYPDAVPDQLVTESYRPRTGGPRRRGQGHDPFLELLGPADQRLPEPLAVLSVEGGENLAAASIEDGEARAVLFPRMALKRNTRIGALPHSRRNRVQRADAGHRQAKTRPQPPRGGDTDPQAGERAGPEADAQQADPLPAAASRGTALDLVQQRGRV